MRLVVTYHFNPSFPSANLATVSCDCLNEVGESCDSCQHIVLGFSPTYLVACPRCSDERRFSMFCIKRKSCEWIVGAIPLSFSTYLYLCHHLWHQCLRCCPSHHTVAQHGVVFVVRHFLWWVGLAVRRIFVAVYFHVLLVLVEYVRFTSMAQISAVAKFETSNHTSPMIYICVCNYVYS